jgi:hypothetical protein
MIRLVHRTNSTAADVIQNIFVGRYENITNNRRGSATNIICAPNCGRIVFEVARIYPNILRQLAWFILFVYIPFVMMWITHADMVLVAIVGMTFRVSVFAYGGSQYLYVGVVSMTVAVVSRGW